MSLFYLLVFIIVLSILVLVHELGHFFAAKLQGVRVEEFGLGLPPRIYGISYKGTIYSINLLPFGGFVKLFGEEYKQIEDKKLNTSEIHGSFVHKTTFQKSLIITAGVICNFLLGFLITSYIFTSGVSIPTDKVIVTKVMKNSPAYFSGIQKNDQIYSIATNKKVERIKTSENLIALTKKYAGTTIQLTIKRNSSFIPLSIIPRKKPAQDQGPLGIVISNSKIVKYPISIALIKGFQESIKVITLTATEFGKIILKAIQLQPVAVDVLGPIGIYYLTSEVAKSGIYQLLQLMALLSLNLAFINILPFPALDGGRLAMILYEGITKKRINPNIESKLNYIGFGFLLILILLISIKDITQIQKIKEMFK